MRDPVSEILNHISKMPVHPFYVTGNLVDEKKKQINNLIQQMDNGNLKKKLLNKSANRSSKEQPWINRIHACGAKYNAKYDFGGVRVARSLKKMNELFLKLEKEIGGIKDQKKQTIISDAVNAARISMLSINGMVQDMNTENMICKLLKLQHEKNNIHNVIKKIQLQYMKEIKNIIENVPSPKSVFNR